MALEQFLKGFDKMKIHKKQVLSLSTKDIEKRQIEISNMLEILPKTTLIRFFVTETPDEVQSEKPDFNLTKAKKELEDHFVIIDVSLLKKELWDNEIVAEFGKSKILELENNNIVLLSGLTNRINDYVRKVYGVNFLDSNLIEALMQPPKTKFQSPEDVFNFLIESDFGKAALWQIAAVDGLIQKANKMEEGEIFIGVLVNATGFEIKNKLVWKGLKTKFSIFKDLEIITYNPVTKGGLSAVEILRKK